MKNSHPTTYVCFYQFDFCFCFCLFHSQFETTKKKKKKKKSFIFNDDNGDCDWLVGFAEEEKTLSLLWHFISRSSSSSSSSSIDDDALTLVGQRSKRSFDILSWQNKDENENGEKIKVNARGTK